MGQPFVLTKPLRWSLLCALIVAAYSCLSLLKPYPPFSSVPAIPSGLDGALAFVITLIMAFRVNRAYDRWWEARKLWGTLVNVSRNLAVKIRELCHPDDAERRAVRNYLVAFALGLKDHLRDCGSLQRLPGFESEMVTPRHLPGFLVRPLYRLLERWQSEGRLSSEKMWILDSELRSLLDVCGACERIKTTLMSISWRAFTSQAMLLYLLIMPWGLFDDFGAWTIPLAAVIGYFVVAGERIARTVEEPFGLGRDHLDLDRITTVIDQSVSELLDVVNRPSAERPE